MNKCKYCIHMAVSKENPENYRCKIESKNAVISERLSIQTDGAFPYDYNGGIVRDCSDFESKENEL